MAQYILLRLLPVFAFFCIIAIAYKADLVRVGTIGPTEGLVLVVGGWILLSFSVIAWVRLILRRDAQSVS